MDLVELVFSDNFNSALTWKLFRAVRRVNVAASKHRYVDSVRSCPDAIVYTRRFGAADLIVLEIGTVDVDLTLGKKCRRLSYTPEDTLFSSGLQENYVIIPEDSRAVVWYTTLAKEYMGIFGHKWAGYDVKIFYVVPVPIVSWAGIAFPDDIYNYGYKSFPDATLTDVNGVEVRITNGEISAGGYTYLRADGMPGTGDELFKYLFGFVMFRSNFNIGELIHAIPSVAGMLILLE